MPAPVVVFLSAERGHKLGLGTRQIAQLLHRDGQEAQGAWVFGIEAEGLQQPGLGSRGVVQVQLDEAGQLQGFRVLSVQGQRLLERKLRAIEILHEQAQVAEVAKMAALGGVLVPEGFQLPQQLQSFLLASMVAEAEQPLEPGLRVGAVLGQQLVQDFPGLVVAGAPVIGAGQGQAVVKGGSCGSLECRQARVQQLEPRSCHGMPREGVQGITWRCIGRRRVHRRAGGPWPPVFPPWPSRGGAGGPCGAPATNAD